MKVLLRLDYEVRNVPLPSGTAVLADPLPGSIIIELETEPETLHRDVMTKILELGNENTHITHFQIWILADERTWDEPFEMPEIPPERLRLLQSLLDSLHRDFGT